MLSTLYPCPHGPCFGLDLESTKVEGDSGPGSGQGASRPFITSAEGFDTGRPFWALGAASSQGPPCLPEEEVLPDSAAAQPHLPHGALRIQNLPCLSCSRVSLPNPLWPACPRPHLMLTYYGVRPPTEPFNHPQSKATPQAQATGRENKTRSCAVMSADRADGRSNKN